MRNIKDFDDYVEYHALNEALNDGSQSVCNKAFINGGVITFNDGTSVHPKEIVNAVNEALSYLADQYTRTFKFGNRLNIIYLAHSSKYKTMAVDQYMNLYMNAGFIYHTLKMDKKLIAAVIMHEVLHVLFNHIERGKNWLGSKGKAVTNSNWNDNNLAADVEVNQTLVRLDMISEDDLINTIHGIYLLNSGGQRGSRTNVVPMEVILDDEEYMKKLRSMHPVAPDPETKEKNKIKTTDEWNKGYKAAWNKLAGLIKKYGYKEAWNKLLEAGVINGGGELNDEKEISDIMGIEFLQIKSVEELNESLKVPESDKGQTYDDGFVTGFNKLLSKLQNAMNPGGGDGESQSGGDFYDTGMENDELDEVDLPQDREGEEGEGDGLPENVKSNGKGQGDDKDGEQNGDGGDSGDNDSGSKKSSKAGKGGNGKKDEELTDDDVNKLANDVKKKYKNGGGEKHPSEEEDPGAIGGTGSFVYGDMKDDVLRDAGYSHEDIDSINEIRAKNKEKNTPKGIEKARQEMRNSLNKTDFLGKMLSAIDVESQKYKNIWKEVMEDFLAKKTRRAGTKVNDVSINWKRKSRIALGQVGPQYEKVDQDPQDVNIYVDVSGSVDVGLLEVISKSLVIFTQEYEYSGINICPWASTTNGISKVDDFRDRDEDEITEEILKVVSKGIAQCGGGTEAKAVIAAMVDAIAATLADDDKEQKDDVHVVITDGQFDFGGIEGRIESVVKHETSRPDVASMAPENTFWMIYDAPEYLQDSWKKEIRRGRLIFINSETVKNNK